MDAREMEWGKWSKQKINWHFANMCFCFYRLWGPFAVWGWIRIKTLHMVHVLKRHLDDLGISNFDSKRNASNLALGKRFEGVWMHTDA